MHPLPIRENPGLHMNREGMSSSCSQEPVPCFFSEAAVKTSHRWTTSDQVNEERSSFSFPPYGFFPSGVATTNHLMISAYLVWQRFCIG